MIRLITKKKSLHRECVTLPVSFLERSWGLDRTFSYPHTRRRHCRKVASSNHNRQPHRYTNQRTREQNPAKITKTVYQREWGEKQFKREKVRFWIRPWSNGEWQTHFTLLPYEIAAPSVPGVGTIARAAKTAAPSWTKTFILLLSKVRCPLLTAIWGDFHNSNGGTANAAFGQPSLGLD